ncbi:MAG: PadR family transcriptional regulator [Lachnospiraceae bacterium]|nr:PadR family transcriptional regulator [Lachnospiraceae bacterium]
MEKEEIVAGLTMELRRGTIVLGVLSQLDKPMYGYHLVNELSAKGIIVETNTLYPLLRRLEKQGVLESTWETGEAKPRKYYRRTKLGGEIYELLREQWLKTTENMRKLMN